MPDPITVTLELDPATVPVLVDACRAQAAARRRAAEKASRLIIDDQAENPTRDIRTGAAHVVRMLDAADRLEAAAADVEAQAAGQPRRRRRRPEAAAVEAVDDPDAGVQLGLDDALEPFDPAEDDPHPFEGTEDDCASCGAPAADPVHGGAAIVDELDAAAAELDPLTDPDVAALRELARA